MLNTKDFIPSFKQPLQLERSTCPYLFFHIPKSAGMSLVAGMVSCFERVEHSLPYQVWRGRADSPRSDENQTVIRQVKSYLAKHGAGSIGGFVASHSPMEVLREAGIAFKLITVLRKTEDRVLSAYNYDCMRKGRLPSRLDFEKFIHCPSNQNVSVKTILGIEDISGGEASLASELLNETFFAFCFIEDINLLISTLLSLEGLPNLQIGRENKTIDTYRYNPSSAEIEIIKTLNTEDEELINSIGYGCLKLPSMDISNGMSDNVVQVFGRQTSERYGYHSRIKKLSQLQNTMVS